MKILSEYIEEHKLLLNKWIGQWSLKEYKEAFTTFKNTNETSKIKNIIHDISNLKFELDEVEVITELVQIRKKLKDSDYKVVYITDKPQDVVFSHLYAKALKNGYLYNYCTTTKEALEILTINMTPDDLKNKLSKLKKSDT